MDIIQKTLKTNAVSPGLRPVLRGTSAERRLAYSQHKKWRNRSLRPGDWVEVRSFAEIGATLDDRGELQGLPFMPEMLGYCGRRFEVLKRANKTCDEALGGQIRKLEHTVHLKELRCSGDSHGGCDAGCLLFWKEQWLKRIDPNAQAADFEPGAHEGGAPLVCEHGNAGAVAGMADTIARATRYSRPGAGRGQELFSCQSTEITSFSKSLPWWDLRQYASDLCCGNVAVRDFLTGLFIGMYNKLQDLLGGQTFGFVAGANVKTPEMALDLSPGDLVQIKSKRDVVATLDRRGKNRGLGFRPVMVPYCGKQFRVLRRVRNVINPRTRELVFMGGRCVILDGVVCRGSIKRFCPRMVYQYWRDIWLTKVPEPEPGSIACGPVKDGGELPLETSTRSSRIANGISFKTAADQAEAGRGPHLASR
jgi:hypothetical protein